MPESGISSLTQSGRGLTEKAADKSVDVYLEADAQHAKADQMVGEHIDRDKSTAHNLVGAAVTLGLTIIMLILMALVAGYFVEEAPSDGAFNESITRVQEIGGTGFILLAVGILAIPVVAIVGYFVNSGLGGFIGGGMGR